MPDEDGYPINFKGVVTAHGYEYGKEEGRESCTWGGAFGVNWPGAPICSEVCDKCVAPPIVNRPCECCVGNFNSCQELADYGFCGCGGVHHPLVIPCDPGRDSWGNNATSCQVQSIGGMEPEDLYIKSIVHLGPLVHSPGGYYRVSGHIEMAISCGRPRDVVSSPCWRLDGSTKPGVCASPYGHAMGSIPILGMYHSSDEIECECDCDMPVCLYCDCGAAFATISSEQQYEDWTQHYEGAPLKGNVNHANGRDWYELMGDKDGCLHCMNSSGFGNPTCTPNGMTDECCSPEDGWSDGYRECTCPESEDNDCCCGFNGEECPGRGCPDFAPCRCEYDCTQCGNYPFSTCCCESGGINNCTGRLLYGLVDGAGCTSDYPQIQGCDPSDGTRTSPMPHCLSEAWHWNDWQDSDDEAEGYCGIWNCIKDIPCNVSPVTTFLSDPVILPSNVCAVILEAVVQAQGGCTGCFGDGCWHESGAGHHMPVDCGTFGCDEGDSRRPASCGYTRAHVAVGGPFFP